LRLAEWPIETEGRMHDADADPAFHVGPKIS
jgi:hypothetical protein